MILAGGLATRLGGDKALAPFAGATLLDAVIARLSGAALRLAINANGDPARFGRFGLPVVPDEIAGFPGPLAGILAALDWARDLEAVATVPTDAPLLPVDLLPVLGRAAIASPGAIICAESAGRLHPVVALWPTRLAADLRHAIIADGMRRVTDFLARHRVVRAGFPIAGYDPLMNVNTAADLALAERLASLERRSPGAK
jgi:molybdopterin-guanine dinucleotide biosynthesis protein A